MKKVCLLLCFTYSCLFLFSQTFENETYDWAANPKPFKPAMSDTGFNEIGLKDKRIIEIAIVNDMPIQLFIRHTTKFVNSNEAIERNNKISVPYNNETNIVTSKVRVIQPDGTVIELGSDDIKEAEDETSKRKYKYFAVRGLVLGSTIEQIFIKKSTPTLSGNTYDMQFQYPNRNASFAIIYPDNLVIETKSYAGFPEFKEDTSILKKMRKYVDSADIPALNKENYSNYSANVQRLSFKLSGNLATGKMNLYSFSKWGESIFNSLNPTLAKSDLKLIEKYLKTAQVNTGESEENQIRQIEAYVKKNKFVDDNTALKKVDMATLLNARALPKFEMTQLFCCLLNYLKISHQEVVTNDRFDEPFDPKFENYSHLQEFAIYLPKEDKYLAPTETFFRYPLIPNGWINNYGLFIKPIQLGDVTMGMTEKKIIHGLDYTYSVDTMNIRVDMTQDMLTPTYQYHLTYLGYAAQQFQPVFDFIPEEDKEKTRKEIVANYLGDKDEIKVTTENEGTDFFGFKPFIINAEIHSSKLTEKVGDQYLFKLGETIGRQMEMYQEGTRKLPIELENCHGYARTITVLLPDEYTVANLDKLNLSFKVMQEGKEVTAFNATYTVTGNVLQINNLEYYNTLSLPIEQYEAYKNVVNAAADFNKIVLVLNKK